jgi:hypothetical protein
MSKIFWEFYAGFEFGGSQPLLRRSQVTAG